MKRLLSLVLPVTLVVAAASCAGNKPQDVAPEGSAAPTSLGQAPDPVASASPTPSASAPAPQASASAAPAGSAATPANAPLVGAWMDDDVIAALAKDCHFANACLTKISAIAKRSTDSLSEMPPSCAEFAPMACAAVAGQSCAPDECSQTDMSCVPACDDKCGKCSNDCTSACDKCKSHCKDDACKLECAGGCAKCHQRCLVSLDQCSTAGCSTEAEKCFADRDDEWNHSTCEKVCDKVSECVEACPSKSESMYDKYMSACAKGCMTKLGKGCPKRFEWICMGSPDAAVNFFAYHTQRQEEAAKKNAPPAKAPAPH